MNSEKTPNTPPMANNVMKVRILVVDDDLVNLALTTSVLKVFNYEVITTGCPLQALTTLQKNNGFEIVLSSANMPLINGFNFQRIIEEEFRIPVVLMSAKDKRDAVVNSWDKNATLFLMVKPPSVHDLKYMWEYVALRKKSWGINVDIASYGIGVGIELSTEMVPREDPSIEVVLSQSTQQSNNNPLITLSDSQEQQQLIVLSSDDSQENQQLITISDDSQEHQQLMITLSSDDSQGQLLQSISTILDPQGQQQALTTFLDWPQQQQQQQQPITIISDPQDLQQSITTISDPQERQNSTSSDNGGSNSSSDGKKNSGNSRKSKIQWTPLLHNKFLEAISVIGSNRAVPKKILEYMNIPGLNRENIASHLQKFRIYERRKKELENPLIRGMSRNWSEKPFGLSNFSWSLPPPPKNNVSLSTYSKALNLNQQQKHLQQQAIELANTSKQLAQKNTSQGVNMLNSPPSTFVQSPSPSSSKDNNNISANNLVHNNSTKTMNNFDSTLLNNNGQNNNNSTQTSSALVSAPMQFMPPSNNCMPLEMNNNGLVNNVNNLGNNPFMSPNVQPQFLNQNGSFFNGGMGGNNLAMSGYSGLGLGLGQGQNYNGIGNFGNMPYNFNNNNLLGNNNFATNDQLLNMSNMNNVANVNSMANNFPNLNKGSPTMYPMVNATNMNNNVATMFPSVDMSNLNNAPTMFPPVNLSGMNNVYGGMGGSPVNNVFDTNNVANMFPPVSMNMNMNMNNGGYTLAPPTSMPTGVNQNVMPTIYPQASLSAGMNNVVSPNAPSANLADMNGGTGFAQPVTDQSGSNDTGTIDNVSAGQVAVAANSNSNSNSPVNQPVTALDKDMSNFDFAGAVPTPQDWALNSLDDFSMNIQEYATTMDDLSAIFPNVGAYGNGN